MHHLKNPDRERSDIFLLDSVPPYSDITHLLNACHEYHNKLKIGVCTSHAGTPKAIPLWVHPAFLLKFTDPTIKSTIQNGKLNLLEGHCSMEDIFNIIKVHSPLVYDQYMSIAVWKGEDVMD